MNEKIEYKKHPSKLKDHVTMSSMKNIKQKHILSV